MAPEQDKSLMHDHWIATLDTIVEKNGTASAVGELASLCAGVLRHCGNTPELKEFIDKRSLIAFGNVERRKS